MRGHADDAQLAKSEPWVAKSGHGKEINAILIGNTYIFLLSIL